MRTTWYQRSSSPTRSRARCARPDPTISPSCWPMRLRSCARRFRACRCIYREDKTTVLVDKLEQASSTPPCWRSRPTSVTSSPSHRRRSLRAGGRALPPVRRAQEARHLERSGGRERLLLDDGTVYASMLWFCQRAKTEEPRVPRDQPRDAVPDGRSGAGSRCCPPWPSHREPPRQLRRAAFASPARPNHRPLLPLGHPAKETLNAIAASFRRTLTRGVS